MACIPNEGFGSSMWASYRRKFVLCLCCPAWSSSQQIRSPVNGLGFFGHWDSWSCILIDYVIHAHLLSLPSCRVHFSADSTELWVLTSDSNLLRYRAADGTLLQQLQQPHPGATCSCFTLIPSLGMVATGGSDQIVKLWRYDEDANGGGKELAGVGVQSIKKEAAAAGGGGQNGPDVGCSQGGSANGVGSRGTDMAELKLWQSFVGQQGTIAGEEWPQGFRVFKV